MFYLIKNHRCQCGTSYTFAKLKDYDAVVRLVTPLAVVLPLLPVGDIEFRCPTCKAWIDLPPEEILDPELYRQYGGTVIADDHNPPEAHNGGE